MRTTTRPSQARRPKPGSGTRLFRPCCWTTSARCTPCFSTGCSTRPLDGPDNGLDDTEHAEADIQEHIAVALIQMKGDTLQRLREALVRLEAGEYGDCADCGCEISEKRLQALPFALRCTACESTHEQDAARSRHLDRG